MRTERPPPSLMATGELVSLLRSSWYTLAAMVLMTIQPFLTMLTMNGEGAYDCAATFAQKHVT